MARVRTLSDFVEKARLVHDDVYDYSEVVYVKSNLPVRIKCAVHGIFDQTPNKHLAGHGCPQCGRERTRLGKEMFVQRAMDVHGDKYDYSKVVYVNKYQKVCIICPEHGEFWQTPNSHVALKQNCPRCSALVGGLKRMGNNNPMSRDDVKLLSLIHN